MRNCVLSLFLRVLVMFAAFTGDDWSFILYYDTRNLAADESALKLESELLTWYAFKWTTLSCVISFSCVN